MCRVIFVFVSLTHVPPFACRAGRREAFEALVHDSGIAPTSTRGIKEFKRIVDLVFLHTLNEAINCTSSSIAKFLYDRANCVMTSSTRLQCVNAGIDLDGLLPNAFSNKAILQLLAIQGVPFVFKYPSDMMHQGSIAKDFTFCQMITDANEGVFPEGLVEYERFTLSDSSRRSVVGSISKIYAFSLNKWVKPMSSEFIVKVLNRLVRTLESVHSLGFVINDLKPDNIYMNSEGCADIGDFGGAAHIGDPISESTFGFILPEFFESNVSVAAVDWICLINSTFDLMNMQKGDTVAHVTSLLGAIPATYADVRDILRDVLSRV